MYAGKLLEEFIDHWVEGSKHFRDKNPGNQIDYEVGHAARAGPLQGLILSESAYMYSRMSIYISPVIQQLFSPRYKHNG